nr:unnamed protein product [Callosobruchus analis]
MCKKFCEAFELALRAHDETSLSDDPDMKYMDRERLESEKNRRQDGKPADELKLKNRNERSIKISKIEMLIKMQGVKVIIDADGLRVE